MVQGRVVLTRVHKGPVPKALHGLVAANEGEEYVLHPLKLRSVPCI